MEPRSLSETEVASVLVVAVVVGVVGFLQTDLQGVSLAVTLALTSTAAAAAATAGLLLMNRR